MEDKDWQKIGYGSTRLRVPFGWFVMLYNGGPSKTAFFYPDQDHIWDGNALKDPDAGADKRPVLVIPPQKPVEPPPTDEVVKEPALKEAELPPPVSS